MIRRFMKEEDGNAMLLAAAGIIFILIFVSLMMDLGLYYIKIREAESTARLPIEEVEQITMLYASDKNYKKIFSDSTKAYIEANGYDLSQVTASIEKKRKEYNVISMETSVELNDTYQCIFLPIFGIHELEIHVTEKAAPSFNGGSRIYEGGYYVDWVNPDPD